MNLGLLAVEAGSQPGSDVGGKPSSDKPRIPYARRASLPAAIASKWTGSAAAEAATVSADSSNLADITSEC
jgi:hypothetical protein